MKNKTYNENVHIDNELKLRKQMAELPQFSRIYFLGIEPRTSSRTRIAYAYDLGIFFHFLLEVHPLFKAANITQLQVEILDEITPLDIEEYLSYLKYYTRDGREYTNDERAINRKLASLRSFYNYFFRKQMIKTNPASLVQMAKLHEKEIVRFDIDEVVKFLDEVESGDDLTQKQKQYHNKTKIRDLAMMTLMLGTGIRVSECVGLDINDVDFNNYGIRVTRKGGYESVVYFGDEVAEILLSYMEEREHLIPQEGDTDALFLSMQLRRISVRSVEKMVKKYALLVNSLKHITPHKLRSTYGTNLYRETGDIYLVADVLGHKDVNTTRKHYAAQAEDRRRQAARAVKLRKE